MSAAATPDVAALIRSRRFVVLLVLAAMIGLLVSVVAWGFLELVHQIQVLVFTDLPKDLGYQHGAPLWWSLPVLGLAGLVVAAAIVALPGRGGHVPAHGLAAGGITEPVELPGIVLAALATVGLGLVLGPEAPLIALGGGLAVLTVRLARRDAPPELLMVLAAAGTLAALSLIFASPLIAAVIVIEAAGVSGPRLPLVLVPGLLAAGIGSLVSTGMGSWTGLSTSAYALGALALPAFPRPDLADFGWTILLAAAVAIAVFVVVDLALATLPVVTARPWLLLPAAALLVAGLAIAFHQATGRAVDEVLFSGQDALPGLVRSPAGWSLSALALLIVFKGLAWSLSLASFRGGPTFPALFLGAAGGLLAAHLPGFSVTPGVAVGLAAAVVSVLGLPLSAVVLATLLISKAGAGAEPLIVVGVAVAYVVTQQLHRLPAPRPSGAAGAQVADDDRHHGDQVQLPEQRLEHGERVT
jgi:H+/Cl- antiporter ClcA